MRTTLKRLLGSAGLAFVASSLPVHGARAATTLTVDLSTTVGPVTHAAGGSLYGVIETQPADVTGLIAPLHARVFNNPAADVQQPVGDAIVVATRLAPTGAMVSIRLADWFRGFYTFTSMTDWFDKIGQTVSRKKSAGLTNIYGYEIWNEPNGTYSSSNPLPFNQFWMQTFAKLRQLDPGAKLIGPSISFFDVNYLRGFLSFCKTNDCLPDIVGWHELSGGNLTGDLQSYRALEKQIGIGPLPISINEYSGGGDLAVEGQPGASAPLIAKFERFQVDSACISFWDVPHPGRLGSLLATNTAPNGGWWFYKWYGDMSGVMVATIPPTPDSPTALDGFANLDAASRTASVLFGGTNDGTVQLVVTGFHAAPFFGSSVHAVVEHTPFVNRTTPVNATSTVSTSDVVVTGDRITISVPGTNASDGYRLILSAFEDAGTGPLDAGATSGGDSGPARSDGSSEFEAGAPSRADAGADAAAGDDAGRYAADATAGAPDGAAPPGSDAMAGTPSGSGPSASDGCSCRVGSQPSGITATGALGLLGLLAAGRRRVARRSTSRGGT